MMNKLKTNVSAYIQQKKALIHQRRSGLHYHSD